MIAVVFNFHFKKIYFSFQSSRIVPSWVVPYRRGTHIYVTLFTRKIKGIFFMMSNNYCIFIGQGASPFGSYRK